MEKLEVHGFVLAGGKSSRMGADKAQLHFGGRPMVEISVEKLREFCAEVTISGNREDLKEYAEVVVETRVGVGPAAGIEAGLLAARYDWVMFLPVDVPLVPGNLLRRWAEAVADQGVAGCGISYLRVVGKSQPAFAMVHRRLADQVAAAIEGGERKLLKLWGRVGEEGGAGLLWVCEAESFMPEGESTGGQIKRWFQNVNTPQELEEAEAWAREAGAGAV